MCSGGEDLAEEGKVDLTSAVWTWRDTFSEPSSSRFLDLYKDVLKSMLFTRDTVIPPTVDSCT